MFQVVQTCRIRPVHTEPPMQLFCTHVVFNAGYTSVATGKPYFNQRIARLGLVMARSPEDAERCVREKLPELYCQSKPDYLEVLEAKADIQEGHWGKTTVDFIIP